MLFHAMLVHILSSLGPDFLRIVLSPSFVVRPGLVKIGLSPSSLALTFTLET